AMELINAEQLAALRKKHVLSDLLLEARQAGYQHGIAKLTPLAASAEAEFAAAGSRVKELLGLALPPDATLEQIQRFEESYGKTIIGLQMEVSTRDAESKQIDRVVEDVRANIAKAAKP